MPSPHSLALFLLGLRHHFGITKAEFFDEMTFWESEEYLQALPEFFKGEEEKPKGKSGKKNAVDGVHMSTEQLKALGIPVID